MRLGEKALTNLRCLQRLLSPSRLILHSAITLCLAIAMVPLYAARPSADSFNTSPYTPDDMVEAFAIQPDGKIIVGGYFSTLGGQTRRNRLGRLNPDGTLDPDFNPNVGGAAVYCLALQPDNKVLVGGCFTNISGQLRVCLGRLNPDGTLDTTFEPELDWTVSSLQIQPDGKILAGGSFNSVGGYPRQYLARLNPDGSPDTNFNPSVEGYVRSIALQTNGGILVAGSSNYLCRFDPTGALDPAFGVIRATGINCLAVQPDGKILVGGAFTQLNSTPRNRLGRLNSNGSIDAAFNPDFNGTVHCTALQADGKILVGGEFTNVDTQPRSRLARLLPNGTLDDAFDAGVSSNPMLSMVFAFGQQTDGRLLVAGIFRVLADTSCSSFGRLYSTDPATQEVIFSSNSIAWSRGGTSPEVWRATFEFSTNSSEWTALGPAVRTPTGWELQGLNLPSDCSVRARGFLAQGYRNGSACFAQSGAGRPFFLTQALARTNNAGTVAAFSVSASGTGPLTYQWFKDGAPLTDSSTISGAFSPSLFLSNVFRADAGNYFVVASNMYGFATSQVATLSVLEPLITVQPAGTLRNAGQQLSLSATVVGTGPLSYQWFKDGSVVPGQTNRALLLESLQWNDAGNYTLVASNSFGATTSTVAQVIVNLATPDDFNASVSSYSTVYSVAVQPDGAILVGGAFTSLGGKARQNIGRVYPAGSLDTAFNPGANGVVYSLAVQEDSKLLVGGQFTSIGGVARTNIARLYPNGSVDTTFNPGADSGVYCITLQADHKILLAGRFSKVAGQARYYLARLNPDGTLDTAFNRSGSDSTYTLAVQPDGKILVGGFFYGPGARLNPNGSMDSSFNPQADGPAASLLLQPDGKIVATGSFTSLRGQPRAGLGRLNANGTLDGSFNPTVSGEVYCSALQADGCILLGGSFTTVNGERRNGLCRLFADGSLDPTFRAEAYTIYTLALQSDGKLLVGGNFGTLAGQYQNSLGRLNNTVPAAQTLRYEASAVTWLRSGSSPEVWRTTFETSNDGANWTALGPGVCVAGGWQLSPVSLLPGTTIRARGCLATGLYGSSGSLLETLSQLPFNPIILTGNGQFGFTNSQFGFSVLGPAHQSIVIEASTDLLNWVPVCTNAPGPGDSYFTDPGSAPFPRRFYRARAL